MGYRTIVSANGGESPHFQPITRQGSLIFDLTLDQVRNHIAGCEKPLNAMNLKQQLNHASSSSQTASTVPLLPGNYNMNHAPSRKIVDELWRENFQRADEGNAHKQLMLGETTLEDFLVRAGAIIVGSQGIPAAADLQPLTETVMDPAIQQQEDWLSYRFTASQKQQQQQLPQPMALVGSGMPFFANATVSMGFTDTHQMGLPLMSVAPLEMVRPTSSDSVATVTSELKRTDETMDKSIERRQKRMIKNRESAARSRARKQAYINKLEDKVRQLNITNKRLEKEIEVLRRDSTPEPKYQLRRTSSLPHLGSTCIIGATLLCSATL